MTAHGFLRSVTVAALCLACGVPAATRWSSNHQIPDADLIGGGEFVLDAQGFYFADEDAGVIVKPVVLVRLGIIEYVNIEGGYAGGPTLGFKARILGETRRFMPSLAIGAHNIFSHQEVAWYDDARHADMANEFYLALGKTVEPIATRFHLGVQSIPQERSEIVNPFLSVEKYSGLGLYTTLEVQMRHREFIPSLFVSYRFLRRRMEVAAGFVDLYHLFFQDGEFGFSFVSQGMTFTRPGIWFGLRFLGDLRFGSREGFMSMEQRLKRQQNAIDTLQEQIDDLRKDAEVERARLSRLGGSLNEVLGNNPAERERLKALVLDKIVAIKNLYEMEPFEPEKVKEVVNEVTVYRERVAGPLKELLSDKTNDRQIRIHAAMLLGEVGDQESADALLAVLGADEDPGIKIEALIGLGKMGESRAVYLMEQLANDPDDGVAIAAQEVLDRLRRERGIQPSDGAPPRKQAKDSTRAADSAAAAPPSSAKKSSASATPASATPATTAPASSTSTPSKGTPSAQGTGTSSTGKAQEPPKQRAAPQGTSSPETQPGGAASQGTASPPAAAPKPGAAVADTAARSRASASSARSETAKIAPATKAPPASKKTATTSTSSDSAKTSAVPATNPAPAKKPQSAR